MSLKTLLSLGLLLSARVVVNAQLWGDDEDDSSEDRDEDTYSSTTTRPYNQYQSPQQYNPYQQNQNQQPYYNPQNYPPGYNPNAPQQYNPYQQQPRPNQNPYQQQQPYYPRPGQSPYRPTYQQPYQQPRPTQQPYQQPRPYNPVPVPPLPRPTSTVYLPPPPPISTYLPPPVVVTTPPKPVFIPTTSYTWTLPTNWGPARAPFGPHEGTSTVIGDDGLPTGICTTCGPQTIATTTYNEFKVPVPFKTTCGKVAYDEYAVGNALVGGCFYYKKSQKIGDSAFPASFPNGQGFNFGAVKGPFFIFPLIKDASYVGGDGGNDYVVFNNNCYLAGEITNSTDANRRFRGWGECSEEF